MKRSLQRRHIRSGYRKRGGPDTIPLCAGDRLQFLNGEYVVVEQVQYEILEAPVTVYNFEVKDFHTYYVSDSAILVHKGTIKFMS